MPLSYFEKWLSLSLAFTLIIIFYQRSCIHELQNIQQTIKHSSQKRSKRSTVLEYSVEIPPAPSSDHLLLAKGGGLEGGSTNIPEFTNTRQNVDDELFYFPLYTQLSGKSLEKICHEKFGKYNLLKNVNKNNNEEDEEEEEEEEENRTKSIKAKQQQQQQDTIINKSPSKLKPDMLLTTKLKPYNPINNYYHNHHHQHQQLLLHHRKNFKEKVCLPINSFGPKQKLGSRIHQRGAALRRGDQWLLTEFLSGNTVFQFDNKQNSSSFSINNNNNKNLENIEVENDKPTSIFDFPTQIHTLTEPFFGTDSTIGGGGQDPNELIFYYVIQPANRIQALHFHSQRRTSRLLLNASKEPLYMDFSSSTELFGAGSSIDLEIDQTALWAIYRQPNETTLTVSKMSPNSLKELSRWHLVRINSQRLLNSFVSCGILYTVQRNSMNNNNVVVAEFDFRIGKYIKLDNAIEMPLDLDNGTISNVQYDSISDSLSIFNNGNIQSVAINRKRFN